MLALLKQGAHPVVYPAGKRQTTSIGTLLGTQKQLSEQAFQKSIQQSKSRRELQTNEGGADQVHVAGPEHDGPHHGEPGQARRSAKPEQDADLHGHDMLYDEEDQRGAVERVQNVDEFPAQPDAEQETNE